MSNMNYSPHNAHYNFQSSSSSKSEVFDGYVDPEHECMLCCRLMLHPITTPCGHFFCRNCLESCLGYQMACPICRAHCVSNAKPNPQLSAIIKSSYPDLLQKRLAQERKASLQSKRPKVKAVFLPLMEVDRLETPFSVKVMVVGESRFKTLIYRVQQGDGQFGLRNPQNPFGVVCQILSAKRNSEGAIIV
eukprot:Platyproteum_vivax@DN14878_c0_g1_i1.p1